MKKLLITVTTLLALQATAQLNMTLLGNLDYQALRNSDLSNLWGYADELGNEYALVGVNGSGGNTGGLSVVDITDPANPVEIAFIAGPTSRWREIKTWGDYAYVTTEADYGLLIVDLSPLPSSTTLPFTVFNGVGWDTSHSLFIDENGRLYLNGSNRGAGGVIMYDLTGDPMDPVEVGEYDLWYCHDSYARGDTLYAAHLSDGFAMVDVSDPADPVLLGTQTSPSDFTHNLWLDDSGRYLFTTDEVFDAFVGAYDVSDPGDIQFLDKLQSDPGSNTIPHNTYWLNDYLVTSYYTYGVVVYDATHPDNLVETGHYDTSPFSGIGLGDGFNGAWGVYPFLPSGNLIVSDIEEGLWIIASQYTHACWLEGTVTDAVTTSPLNNASITVLGSAMQETTGLDGLYATGTPTAGTYDVLFEAVGYAPQTITGVALVNGVLTIQDAALVPLVPFDFSGQVIDADDATGVANAFLMLEGDDVTYSTQADANGAFTFEDIFAGDYTLTSGQWGWVTDCSFNGAIDPGTSPMIIELEAGWYDDFTFDYDWITGSTASTGDWERGEPEGTISDGEQCNPEFDVVVDCGDQAYVTGNGGGGAGSDDVDDGYVRLVSPVVDLAGYIDPYLDFASWFFNGGGMGAPNDELVISLTNGSDTVVVQQVDVGDVLSTWVPVSERILDLLPATATMRLIVETADEGGGHLVEAGLDHFHIWEHSVTGILENGGAGMPLIFPNPGAGVFTLVDPLGTGLRMEVRDAQGRLVATRGMTSPSLDITLDIYPGMYSINVIDPSGSVRSARLVVTD